MTASTLLVAWLVRAMLLWAPAPKDASDFERAAIELRYEQIATDAQSVSFDLDEPPIFRGPNGRAQTALYALSVAFWESKYSPKIERGECRRGECDGGLAFGLMQIHPERGIVLLERGRYRYADAGMDQELMQTTPFREVVITRADILRDRRSMFRAGIRIMRDSYRVCGSLAVYASGSCDGGLQKAAQREETAKRYLRTAPPPVKDAQAMRET